MSFIDYNESSNLTNALAALEDMHARSIRPVAWPPPPRTEDLRTALGTAIEAYGNCLCGFESRLRPAKLITPSESNLARRARLRQLYLPDHIIKASQTGNSEELNKASQEIVELSRKLFALFS